jgi:hypothetical protein
MLLVTVSMTMLSVVAMRQQQAHADFIQHVLCTWGTDDASASENADDDGDYSPSPVRMIYQLSQTEDLAKSLVYKSEVGAESALGNDSWPNVLTRKDFDKATLDIVNTSNATKTKYTPYDLYGFSSLKWTGYQGEWNWIKVYYCGASGTGDDAKDPEDQKLNLYYPDRNRPRDQYADRFSSSDPRVQLKGVNTAEIYRNNFTLNIANFIFSITKTVVALNNAFIELSFSNVASDMGLDKVASSIMTNLMNGLFLPMVVFMIALTGCYIAYKALFKRQTTEALKEFAKVLLCLFLGYLVLAMPTVFANLANDVGITMQYIVMSATTSTIKGSSSEMCSTTVTASTVKKDDSLSLFKNGHFNTKGIQNWGANLSNATGRTLSCQYWRIFAVIPWSLGQYGTDVNNLYASGYAEQNGKEMNPNGTQGDWVGLAAVPLGDGQVSHNWAIYQISAQSKNHIPSTIADAKTGEIKNENKLEYKNVDQVQRSGRIIDSTNGDWWRVVDAVSGYDTVNQDGSTKSSTTSINTAVKKAKAAVDAGGQGTDSASMIASAYTSAGIKLSSSSVGSLANDAKTAGFHKITGANLNTGDGLKPGDILIGGGQAAMYYGSKSTLSSSGTGGLSGFTEAWRMGTGGSASSVSGSSSSDAIAFAGSDDLLRYTKLDGANLTDYWSNWIGGNAANRVSVAIMSLIALVALIIPLFLGATLIILACGSVILMAFLPVVLLMGLWAGPGSQIVKEYIQMIWSVVTKRIAFGMLYVIILVLTSKIFSGVTGSMDYLKSIILTLFVSYAVYANKDKLARMFTSAMGAVQNNTLERVGSKATGMMTGAGKFAGGAVGGAALGAVKRQKIYAQDANGEYKRDKWGNRIVTGKARYGSINSKGEAVHGTVKQILNGARRGASGSMKTRTKMGLYQSEFGRQLLHTNDQIKSIKNRNAVRNELINSGKTPDQINEALRERIGEPCSICNNSFLPEELTMYSTPNGSYYVCDQCASDYGIGSGADIEAIIGI